MGDGPFSFSKVNDSFITECSDECRKTQCGQDM